jgi:hypothetical protein
MNIRYTSLSRWREREGVRGDWVVAPHLFPLPHGERKKRKIFLTKKERCLCMTK